MLAAATTNPTTQSTLAAAGRDQLIHGHVDMAKRLARKVARRIPPSVGHDELESAALLGLTEAASRFDPSRGEPFVAFAAKRIRGAVLDELRRCDVLTRRGREAAKRLAEATREVEHRTGGPAGAEDVARELGVSTEDVEQARGRFEAAGWVPLDELTDFAPRERDDTPAELCAREEEKRALASALGDLPRRDLLVLNMYFQDGLTLREIGDLLGITESRVSQLRTRSLRALRAAVEPADA